MFTDVMIDLETYGTRPGSIILSIGAIDFSRAGMGSDEYYGVINLPASRAAGFVEDPNTVAWWAKQKPEAQQVLLAANGPDSSPPAKILEDFGRYLNQHGGSKVNLWGNGSDFDNVLLAEYYLKLDMALPWRFFNNRCYRTLKNLVRTVAPNRQGTHHNALDDAKTQAAHAVELLKALP